MDYGPRRKWTMLNAAHILLQTPRTDVRGESIFICFQIRSTCICLHTFHNEIMHNAYNYYMKMLIIMRYSVAFPFLRWGIFLPLGTVDFRKFLTSLIFILFYFVLSSNAIIKQCNIHIHSISNLGYHTIL